MKALKSKIKEKMKKGKMVKPTDDKSKMEDKSDKKKMPWMK